MGGRQGLPYGTFINFFEVYLTFETCKSLHVLLIQDTNLKCTPRRKCIYGPRRKCIYGDTHGSTTQESEHFQCPRRLLGDCQSPYFPRGTTVSAPVTTDHFHPCSNFIHLDSDSCTPLCLVFSLNIMSGIWSYCVCQWLIFQCRVAFPCTEMPSSTYAFFYGGTFGLFPVWGYYRLSCREHLVMSFGGCTLSFLLAASAGVGCPGPRRGIYLAFGGAAERFCRAAVSMYTPAHV